MKSGSASSPSPMNTICSSEDSGISSCCMSCPFISESDAWLTVLFSCTVAPVSIPFTSSFSSLSGCITLPLSSCCSVVVSDRPALMAFLKSSSETSCVPTSGISSPFSSTAAISYPCGVFLATIKFCPLFLNTVPSSIGGLTWDSSDCNTSFSASVPACAATSSAGESSITFSIASMEDICTFPSLSR